MNVPSGLWYTKTHEWAKQDGQDALVGITSHAQEELRDVVYVELPPVGKAVKAGDPTAIVESVKAAFDIYAPIGGTIARVNQALAKSPQLVNQDCYGQGWFFAIAPAQPEDVKTLLDADAYAALTNVEAH